jgi:signal transduction histidine kinase
MNLGRVRITLTLWYTASVIAVVMLITIPAYLLLTDKLGEEADETLYSSAAGIAAQLGSVTPLPVTPKDDPFDYISGNRGDYFYAVLSPGGQPVLNPLGVDLAAFAGPASLAKAQAQGSTRETVSFAGHRYRVVLLTEGDYVVAVGRSDTEHQRERDLILLIVAGSGVISVLVALVGGWYLGGRALTPAREAFERQREFVADASHELRTPLTVIRTNAEAVSHYGSRSLTDVDRQAVNDIVEESTRMGDLVEDLLTLARLDAPETEFVASETDLVELARESLRFVQPLADEKRITLTLEAPVSIRLQSEPLAISRVLRVLLENAVEYSDSGGNVILRCHAESRHAVAQVLDSGPGIDPDALDRIFQRFFRSDTARSRNGHSGLGLAIARGLMLRLGGQVTASNRVGGRGAIFTITLPAHP